MTENAIILYKEDGTEVELPVKFELCSRCEGKGTHVNPAVDGNGITGEEWANDWDEDSREMYMTGGYDVSCYACHGKRVVPVADRERMSDDDWREYMAQLDEDARDAEVQAYELRMGC